MKKLREKPAHLQQGLPQQNSFEGLWKEGKVRRGVQ